MQKSIFLELKSILNLEINQCYNKIIEAEEGIHIIKSKYANSSIYEIREIVDIIFKLKKYEKCLDIVVALDKVILKYK